MINFQFSIFKLKAPTKQPGESILEVVIATVILSSVLIATFSILQRALDTNINIKNRVIALNIAREGLEAVRNIRDTNWLKYSGDRRGKWLCYDNPTQPDACEGTTSATDFLVDDTYYTVDFDTGVYRYYLDENTMAEDIDFLSSGAGQANREDFRLYLTPTSPQRYTHESTGNTETIFYRQIYLDIANPYDGTPPAFCDGDDASCNEGRVKVISRVYWQEDGRQRATTVEGHLYDFFARDDY